MLNVNPEEAQSFLEDASFVWYQRFALAPNVYTRGLRDLDWTLQSCRLPSDLRGLSVLDIGTTNGGMCFEMERRGASRIVATDIYPSHHFGFDQITKLLGSSAEFVQASIYELPTILQQERFDIVFFLGVLYHLRHPLLALDNVRSLTKGQVFIETEVADNELQGHRNIPLARFYRLNERADDYSNWFAPTLACLHEWCISSGLETEVLLAWPGEAPQRCLVRATPSSGDPEYVGVSYERPLRASIEGAPIV